MTTKPRAAASPGIGTLAAASHDAGRARATARELGLRLRTRGPRRRATYGWESLTPTEKQVVGLVTEGLTNPEVGERLYISRRTVSTHLTHVFSKLGVKSRTELATAAAGEPRG